MTIAYDDFARNAVPPAEALPEFLFAMPTLQYPDRMNAAALLLRRQPADALAVINDAGQWTYGEMDALSDRIARLLREEEGLAPGNRVLLRGVNSAMLFAAWAGVLKAGGIVVTTMPLLRGGEVAPILAKARISHAIVDARSLEGFDQAAAGFDGLASLVTYAGDSGSGALEARLASIAPGFAAHDSGRDDVALIAFTSGTTGEPKGCIQYHRDIMACADSFARHLLDPRPGDRWACSAPIAFTFGLGQLLIFPWATGGTAVTIEAPGPKALLDAIDRFGITILATAPTAYKAMLGLLEGHKLASLRTCVSAGEFLPAATSEAWTGATGHRIVEGIGATEMMHIFISAAGDDIRPGSTGKAVPGYVACVLDDDDQPLAEGVGRLAVKGPTGCRYFADHRQANYVINGWNVTGDRYRLDSDGYFSYIGRSDDMIISSGYNIAAIEVEAALVGHPAVLECGVIGVPCPERGQKVKAFVVLAPGYQGDAVLVKAIQDHVKAIIAPYKYPREIELVDALPKTATGKLQRFALRPKD
ncbi:AMP-binding protein [Polymorphobacter sp.]|uniref:AMP-binding protein n=1 Tax=Polymorphobacter sp. TaxID=1909290 RepID=UPI003F7290BB